MTTLGSRGAVYLQRADASTMERHDSPHNGGSSPPAQTLDEVLASLWARLAEQASALSSADPPSCTARCGTEIRCVLSGSCRWLYTWLACMQPERRKANTGSI